MTTGIPQRCLSCRFEVLVNFWQVFALFLGAFIVDFGFSLFIVNVIKRYRNYINVIFIEVVAKH